MIKASNISPDEIKSVGQKQRTIDVKKIVGKSPIGVYEAIEALGDAHQEILEALHIMQSTIDNWEDAECLKMSKERMTKFLNKFCS